jgi:uncharacterized membrane protein YfcA
MIYIGYILLLLMGMILGLLGAGGSILTIPILIYFFHMPMLTASSYSLVMVGIIAFLSTIPYRDRVSFKDALLFSIPSTMGVFASRFYILRHMPETFLYVNFHKFIHSIFIVFMFLAGLLMNHSSGDEKKKHYKNNLHFPDSRFVLNYLKIVFAGGGLGMVMGIIGAGGGFLIVPVLILMMEMPINKAVPTSLFIVTLNSLVGFFSDPFHFTSKDWISIFIYLIWSLLGMVFGIYIAKHIQVNRLKKGFSWLIICVAISMGIKEFIL